MTHPDTGSSELWGPPPNRRGLGAMGYLVAAGLLLVAFLLLNSSTTFTTSVEIPSTSGTDGPVQAEVVCLSVLSGGPSGQDRDLADDQVEEWRVDEQPGVLAQCSQQRDQAIGRALLVGTSGVLLATVVTGLVVLAAARRRSVSAR